MSNGTEPGPDEVLARQRAAAIRDGAPDVATRQAMLKRLDRMLLDGAEAFGAAIAADFGHRAWPETVLAELAPLRSAIGFARRRLPGWCRPRRAAVPLNFRPGSARVVPQPLGCIGIVSPWNYPLFLSVGPLVDALAAGNRAMIKPSELAPCFAAELADRLGRCFPPERVAVVQGGETVARAFCALPFDHLLFTGSTRVGREVAAIAAGNLVPVTLELGGKSPVLVAPDRSGPGGPERVARSLMIGKLFNAGQTCIAPDHVLVPEADTARFAEACAREAARLYPCLADNPDYTAIISPRHRARLEALVAEAAAAGARVLRHPDAAAAERSNRMAPVVLLDVPDHCAVMREEIFGPVLPVLGYRSLDAALARLAAGDRPLALYCYTADRAIERRVTNTVPAGGMTVNGTLLHCAVPDLPFGGIGASGTGAYHGEAGFRRFSHSKGVYRAGAVGGFTALRPPHGAMMRRLLPFLLGRSTPGGPSREGPGALPLAPAKG